MKFIEGHRRVLSIYGIENITSNTNDWMYRRSMFVIVVEKLDGSKLYGGARIQIADGIHPLPIEDATGKMDPRIYEIVREHAQTGAAELSGLWNSKEVAGFGIGSLFPSRVAVALATQIGINTFFTLCSPTTVRFKDWIGGQILTTVGNNGTFYYPKIDLLATAVYSENVADLSTTHPREKEKIVFLRDNPVHISKEKSPFKESYINIHYNLKLQIDDPKEFHITYEPFDTAAKK
ncbi:MAG: hypothetical protein LW852_06035 [Sediminibacterium sp.]|nr:hypothetical protein [Sediminibacterium sp.]